MEIAKFLESSKLLKQIGFELTNNNYKIHTSEEEHYFYFYNNKKYKLRIVQEELSKNFSYKKERILMVVEDCNNHFNDKLFNFSTDKEACDYLSNEFKSIIREDKIRKLLNESVKKNKNK